jgi:hypothetical protein
MAYECPECHEAAVEWVGMRDDAKTELRCKLCDHEWLHGGGLNSVAAGTRVLTLRQARERFPTPDDVPAAARSRFEQLKAQFLQDRPRPKPEVAVFWAKYQQIFSAEGLPEAAPADLKLFANVTTGANPGNMSVFNQGWNELGDHVAADRLRSVIDYLLRGPEDVAQEDRLEQLIDPTGTRGMRGFRESLLTKVLCVMQPERFLPILTYTSPAGGKREIAASVFGLELPAPDATSWTRGRLIFWGNDLLATLVGDGFVDRQHASQCLWWAKDRSGPASEAAV